VFRPGVAASAALIGSLVEDGGLLDSVDVA
jgi:hypothetical protein